MLTVDGQRTEMFMEWFGQLDLSTFKSQSMFCE